MTDPVPYLAIGGTWAYDGDPSPDEWYHPDSCFASRMQREGLVPVQLRETRPILRRPFVWCGGLDGVIGANHEWRAAGEHAALRLSLVPESERVVIAHSWGGAVALEAAAIVPIARLVTICTPVQRGVEAFGNDLMQRGQIGSWWHVHATGGFWSDTIQALGSIRIGDGRIGWGRRYFRIGHQRFQNVGVPGIDHSRVLNEHTTFYRALVSNAVTAFMRGEICPQRNTEPAA